MTTLGSVGSHGIGLGLGVDTSGLGLAICWPRIVRPSKTNAGSKLLLFTLSFKCFVVGARRESVLAERVDHAAKPCPHDGFDARNIDVVTLQQ